MSQSITFTMILDTWGTEISVEERPYRLRISPSLGII